MPVLARFGQFWQFIGNSPEPSGGLPGLGRKLVEEAARGLALRPLFPGDRRGRPAGDPDGEFLAWGDVGCGVPDGLVVDPRPVVHQKRGRKLASPGGRLCLRHQEIARAEDAGRAIRSEGPRCVAGCIRIRWAGTPSMVCWTRCVAACCGTPTSPGSTAPTTAGIACRPACWPRRSCSSPTRQGDRRLAGSSGLGRTVQLHPQEALLQQARALQQSEALVRLIWSHCLGGAGCCWGLFMVVRPTHFLIASHTAAGGAAQTARPLMRKTAP